MYPTGSEIAKNIHFLGRSGITKISGLSIAFINGLQSNKFSELYTDQYAQNTSFTGNIKPLSFHRQTKIY